MPESQFYTVTRNEYGEKKERERQKAKEECGGEKRIQQGNTM